MTIQQERAKLNTMNNGELVVYWNILQFMTRTLLVDPERKVARHIGIVKKLLEHRGIAAVRGKRLKAA